MKRLFIDSLYQAEANVENAKNAYDEVDRPVFEWLLMLEEYKGDIYDSLLQTLKASPSRV